MSPIDENYILPCDVMLGPATVIRKGCKLSTLLAALNCREGQDWNRLDLSDAKEAIARYRKAVEDVNRMNDKGEITPRS
jgi:hypothetical protein